MHTPKTILDLRNFSFMNCWQQPKALLLGMVFAVSVSAGAAGTQAATLEAWDFSLLPGGTNNYGPSPLAPTVSDPTLSSTISLTRGSGVGTTGSGASKAFGGTGFVTATNTEALAIAGNQVFTFGFTTSADAVNTTSVTDISAYNVRRSATGPATGIFQYQINAGGFIDIGSAITWGAVTSSAGNPETAIDLTGISALQNLAPSSTVTFRIVDWNSTGTSGSWYLNDLNNTTGLDFAINGVVPEPTTVLGGALLIGAAGWSQRRHLRCLLRTA